MEFVVQGLGYFQQAPGSASPPSLGSMEIPSLIDKADLLNKRKQTIGSKCQIFYQNDPFVVSRGAMQYLYDENDEKFVDCISNVQHVGHCHPTVVESICRQVGMATCNVRFVSPLLTQCAEEILKTVEGTGLDTILFCNSGSEANDLAVRLARDYTKQHDVVVLDHAYHGHLTTTMEMSPYKFDHGCTIKQPEWVHVAPTPDVYRGKHRLSDENLINDAALHVAGQQYAQDVKDILVQNESNGRHVGAYIAEALQSCGGQIIPPKGYMTSVAKHIRAHGGVMIIDEVQTGFGRIGDKFWAHQLHNDGFVPDILTMGKPMGNGFPVAAVVTRKEIADSLGGAVGYFNTYGGNPVACAAVLGVMKVIREERLLDHSKQMGILFEKELNNLQSKHECIGDVRGVGMFWGLDLVTDRKSRQPATELALALIMKLRQEHNILLNADGPYCNILKYKPPLCFNEEDLKLSITALDTALSELETKF
uniref:Alanine--glyoxylate aminotransferase 2-like n=1 Tax=Panagrellus redivivus TaxID=6233 RepID=A0A7E4V4M5_PANRE